MQVAQHFGGDQGLILALKSQFKDNRSRMLNVQPLSAYRDEKEGLFMHQFVMIYDVIDLKRRRRLTKEMKALNYFNKLTTGCALDDRWNLDI